MLYQIYENQRTLMEPFVDFAQETAFTAAVQGKDKVKLAERITGINLNGGKALDIGVYVRQEDPP